MSNVERSIEVAVPLAAAYDEWTRFEAYPQFMEGVREVRQRTLRTCTGERASPDARRNGTSRSWSSFPTK